MKFRQIGNEKNTRYYIDQKQVSREEWDKALAEQKASLPQVAPPAETVEMGTGNWKTPILSDALAVHPEQIPQVLERNARHGLHIEYEKEYGRPILRSRSDQRALMKLERAHDNNCFN